MNDEQAMVVPSKISTAGLLYVTALAGFELGAYLRLTVLVVQSVAIAYYEVTAPEYGARLDS